MTEHNLFLTNLPHLMRKRNWKNKRIKGSQSWVYSGPDNYCEIRPKRAFRLKDNIKIELMPSFGRHDFRTLGEKIIGDKRDSDLISYYTENFEKKLKLNREILSHIHKVFGQK